mmetsp:Transcript_4969/g.8223  ORF Transcript_4969/g.8223 Transcript_4969/m.8223 type:complete len:213 (-) Transcript_4969:145-783(-)
MMKLCRFTFACILTNGGSIAFDSLSQQPAPFAILSISVLCILDTIYVAISNPERGAKCSAQLRAICIQCNRHHMLFGDWQTILGNVVRLLNVTLQFLDRFLLNVTLHFFPCFFAVAAVKFSVLHHLFFKVFVLGWYVHFELSFSRINLPIVEPEPKAVQCHFTLCILVFCCTRCVVRIIVCDFACGIVVRRRHILMRHFHDLLCQLFGVNFG